MPRGMLIAAASIAVLAIAAGVAYATIPGPNGVIHGCYGKDGSLRVIDPTSTDKKINACTNKETSLT